MADQLTFPIIDVSEIDNPDRQLAIAKEVTAACQKWGFLLIKGHPIPSSDIDALFSLSKAFFDLAEDQKEPWPINRQSIGYVGSLKDRARDDKMSMWFGGLPGSLDDKEALPPFWRAHSEKVEAFKHQCHSLVVKLLVAFAIAMDLPDRNFFADAHGEHVGDGNSLRMLMYPARNEPPDTTGSRMQPHTDSGSVTLLFQQAAGLEVLGPAGEWVKAPCIKDCILINIGDALSFWSGTQLKATLHRVTFDGLPFNQERQSMAYFGKANPDTVLQPVLPGKAMEKYMTNGLEVQPGITVGELSEMIMTSIYGSSVSTKPQQVAV
ncbi:clavaminate synthase-like protein [Coleophoma cylindrospora]|uniref:Clavaminate synthase-like protein n=1 Tax=Coleophoma cylindrospora TaxID=1849047 RepID=A0A3D8QK34_9HELO|nr:clavaminate synthase-like protein [Coleophoma cylindrospora]